MRKYKRLITAIVVFLVIGCAAQQMTQDPQLTPQQKQEAAYVASLLQDAFNKRVMIFQYVWQQIANNRATEQDFMQAGTATLSQVQWSAGLKKSYPNNPMVEKLVDGFIQGCKKDLEGLKRKYNDYFGKQKTGPTVFQDVEDAIRKYT